MPLCKRKAHLFIICRKLRSGVAGLLRMNPVFEQYGLKDLLPLKLDIPDEGCTRPNASMYCFDAGNIGVIYSAFGITEIMLYFQEK